MFENLFTPSPAIWTALVAGMVALPLLIHLINLMRHKRVEWAAMNFLLKSYKKNRNWVWLKQLLLLLTRIAALLLALFMLAQVGCNQDRISRLLGGNTTHHYVLIDDSFSMTDRGAEGTAFDRARATLSQIAARAKNRRGQLFTLIRYSSGRPVQSAEGGKPSEGELESNVLAQADLNAQPVDTVFEERLENVKAEIQASNLAADLTGGVSIVSQLIQQRENENAIVYVVSDFRAADWNNVAEVDQQLSEIEKAGAAIELISCAETANQNLAITSLKAAGNVRVAGAPLMMEVTVRNFGNSSAEKVQIRTAAKTYSAPADSQSTFEDLYPRVDDLPTIFVDSILPGATVTRQFPVFFSSAGKHVVECRLPEDAISVDNQRQEVIEFKPSAKVLVIDDQQQLHASFLSLAINPSGMTRVQPVIQTKDFLRDTSPGQLAEYDVLFLLDVDRLDESAVRNLEAFASQGGGVAFFLGPNTNLSFYTNMLHRNGEGIFPMPLDRAIEIPEAMEEEVADIVAADHPIFKPITNVKNSMLDLVTIRRVVRPPIEWNADDAADVEVLATVRGKRQWPLVVESRFGAGRVMAFNTTLGPVWNNWVRSPTFPLVLLLSEDRLAAGKYIAADSLVGTPISIRAAKGEFVPAVTFVAPLRSVDPALEPRIAIKRPLQNPEQAEDADWLMAELGQANGVRETDEPGVYEAWLRRTDSSLASDRYALNVDTAESKMELAIPQKILASLRKSKPSFEYWNTFNPEPAEENATSLTRVLLILLLLFLVGEQILAYSASYHPVRRNSAAAKTLAGRRKRLRGAA